MERGIDGALGEGIGAGSTSICVIEPMLTVERGLSQEVSRPRSVGGGVTEQKCDATDCGAGPKAGGKAAEELIGVNRHTRRAVQKGAERGADSDETYEGDVHEVQVPADRGNHGDTQEQRRSEISSNTEQKSDAADVGARLQRLSEAADDKPGGSQMTFEQLVARSAARKKRLAERLAADITKEDAKTRQEALNRKEHSERKIPASNEVTKTPTEVVDFGVAFITDILVKCLTVQTEPRSEEPATRPEATPNPEQTAAGLAYFRAIHDRGK